MYDEEIGMSHFKVLLTAVSAGLLLAQLPSVSPEEGAAQYQPPLNLPKISQPELPKLPAPDPPLEIPAAFFGCWEGNPKGFDAILADPGSRTSTEFGRIVFCYMRDSTEVPEFEIRVVAHKTVLSFILVHLGLGYVRSRFIDANSKVYRVNGSQLLARTTVTLEVTEGWIYKLPVTRRQLVIDEELATIISPASMFVSGRQFLDVSGHRSAADWHASFRRW